MSTVTATRFPPQIKFIIGNEGCERFSFYGMRSILTIFMVQQLAFSDAGAESIYHVFVAACYLMALFGGWLADRWIGRYNTIFYLSLVYCGGHAALAIWESKFGLYLGLSLIAFGSGGIKPCVSALVGDQFTKENSHLVKKVYNLFYWIINFGSFLSTLLIPWIRGHFGNAVAFGIPGVLMGVATFVFWLGRKQYVCVPPKPAGADGFISVLKTALSNRVPGQELFSGAEGKHPAEAIEGARAVVKVSVLFIAVSVFWALFDQHGSSWVLQAKQMELSFMGIALKPSQLAAWNPVMVMGLIPLLTLFVYPALEGGRFELTPLRRMTLGMFVAAGSFFLVGLIQLGIDGGQQLNVMWQFFPYLVITLAEVLISVTGLEFAYTQAPVSMKSTIMSFWLLAVFFGNILTAVVAKVNVFEGASYFFFFTALMVAAAIVFAFLAKRYKIVNYYQD